MESDRLASKPKPWEQGADAESGSFGGWLRRQREMREISLREISETSKISLRYLEALERDRFDLLPASVFARGFLREYARFVGLDPDEVVNYYLVAQRQGNGVEEEEEEDSTPAPATAPNRLGSWTQVLWLGAGVVLAFGLVSALSYLADRSQSGAPAPPSVAAPPPAVDDVPPPVESAQSQLAPLRVTLDFTQNCWVDAFVDGERRVSELRVQGESLQIEANREVQLSLNNPAAVSLEVNGRPFPVPAREDELFTIDLETVEMSREQEG
jgi:cytoskeletal protein RodZ